MVGKRYSDREYRDMLQRITDLGKEAVERGAVEPTFKQRAYLARLLCQMGLEPTKSVILDFCQRNLWIDKDTASEAIGRALKVLEMEPEEEKQPEKENAMESTEYKDMTVSQLRKLAREKKVAPGVWIAGAAKNDLIKALEGKPLPQAATLSGVLADVIQDNLESIRVPESTVQGIVDRYLSERMPQEIVIRDFSSEKVTALGAMHQTFPRLLDLLRLQKHVWVVGPAGSGKSTAVKECAKVLERPYIQFNVGPDTRKSDLYGYMNAVGEYVESLLHKGVTQGAIVCIDEYDSGNASVGTCMNQVLDRSEVVSFGNEMVKKHPNFTVVATANTYGLGANRVYVGRNQIDGATLDRFAYLEFPYDERFERDLSRSGEWTDRVQKYREIADRLGVRAVISPRASIEGSEAYIAFKEEQLAGEWDLESLEDTFIFKGLGQDDKKRLRYQYGQEVSGLQREVSNG